MKFILANLLAVLFASSFASASYTILHRNDYRTISASPIEAAFPDLDYTTGCFDEGNTLGDYYVGCLIWQLKQKEADLASRRRKLLRGGKDSFYHDVVDHQEELQERELSQQCCARPDCCNNQPGFCIPYGGCRRRMDEQDNQEEQERELFGVFLPPATTTEVALDFRTFCLYGDDPNNPAFDYQQQTGKTEPAGYGVCFPKPVKLDLTYFDSLVATVVVP